MCMDHETPASSSDNNRKALILSMFFVGYASCNVLAGMAASRYGGMKMLHWACTGWSGKILYMLFANINNQRKWAGSC